MSLRAWFSFHFWVDFTLIGAAAVRRSIWLFIQRSALLGWKLKVFSTILRISKVWIRNSKLEALKETNKQKNKSQKKVSSIAQHETTSRTMPDNAVQCRLTTSHAAGCLANFRGWSTCSVNLPINYPLNFYSSFDSRQESSRIENVSALRLLSDRTFPWFPNTWAQQLPEPVARNDRHIC